MASLRRSQGTFSLAVRSNRPLIGIVFIEDGQEVTRYFANEREADAAVADHSTSTARSLAGVWNDLDWDETVNELDRIRQEGSPTPPISDL